MPPTFRDRVADHDVDPQFVTRWSPRAFTSEPMPDAVLFSLFEAARWAPSAFNSQPWVFVYAKRDTPAWGPLFDALIPYNQDWVKLASLGRTVMRPARSASSSQSEASATMGARASRRNVSPRNAAFKSSG